MNVWIFADDGCRDLVTTRYLLRLQKKLRTWVCLDVRLVFLSLFSFLFSFILFSFFLLDEVTSFFSLFSYLFILVYSFLLFTFLLSLSSSKFSNFQQWMYFPSFRTMKYGHMISVLIHLLSIVTFPIFLLFPIRWFWECQTSQFSFFFFYSWCSTFLIRCCFHYSLSLHFLFFFSLFPDLKLVTRQALSLDYK